MRLRCVPAIDSGRIITQLEIASSPWRGVFYNTTSWYFTTMDIREAEAPCLGLPERVIGRKRNDRESLFAH
jgi:hypothetical protein